jgi:gliding motility-associated-like protein
LQKKYFSMSKKYLYILNFLLLFFILNAQKTLYWIGGTGKWNDPQHWSLTSGGIPCGHLPDANTKVIIDENSTFSDCIIEVFNDIKIKGLEVQNNKQIYFNAHQYELIIEGNFITSPYFYVYHEKPIVITGSNNTQSSIVRSYSEISGVVKLNKGYFKLDYIQCDKLILDNAVVSLSKSIIKTKQLKSIGLSNLLNISNSIVISDSIYQNNNLKISGNKIHLVSHSISNTNQLFTSSADYKQYTPDQIQSCTVTLTGYSVSCNGVCDGKLVLSFSGGPCGSSPYTLDWSNSSCSPSPTLTNIAGTGNYTISGVCACANAYVVWVYDSGNNLVAISTNVYVNGPSLINFVPTSFIQPLCNGQCNGAINAITSGGTPPPTGYTVIVDGSTTYTNVPQGSAFTYSNLCAGTHTFTVNDLNGCTKTVITNLNQPPVLVPNGSSSNILCNGVCSGSAQVSPSGGTPGYTVNWSTGATNTTAINNLCPGGYTATITDANGCTTTYTTNITEPTSITVVPSQTNVSCFGLCDATASVSVSGGVSLYSYTWSCSGSTTNSASGLCAGNCTVTIKDNNNCIKTQSFTITQPGSITIVPSTTAALCNGSCDGKASFTVSGGSPAFNYTISPGSITGVANPTVTINNLCPGNYTITVMDANNCTQIQTFTITQPPVLSGTVNVTNVTCDGLCNGSATLTPGGGTPPYTFTWSPGSQTINPISFLCAGNYSVLVKDANSCTVTVNYTITQPSSITPNVTKTDVTCNNACNGVINATPSGGTGAYTYTLTSPTTTLTTNPPYSSLCAGTYTLQIKDANSCIQSTVITITQPNALTVIAVSTSVSCFGGCDGSVSGSASGGTPSYTYVWSVPPSGTTFTSAVLTNQCAGIYTLNVVDGNGCVGTKTVNITSPPDITVTATTNSTSCSYNCNGSITTTVTGGNFPYSYNWNTGATTSSITGLCPGTYTLTVTDSKNCTKVQTFTVIAPPAITITTNVQNVLCFGACNGSATATATGGNPGYVYQWNTTPVTTNSAVTGLCPGNYVVTVTDSKGCVASQNISITQPSQLQANITGIQASCSSTCIGAATVSSSGGTPAYSYTWLPSGGNNSVASGLCIGNYTAIVQDINGCTATATVNIPQAIFLTLTTSGNTLTCNGSCNGAANVNVSGGVSPYTYTWTSSTGTISNNQNINGLCAGGYTVTVTDNQGCQNADSVRFTDPPAITITSSNVINNNCFGSCNGQISISAAGGTGSLNYSWTPSGLTGDGTGTVTGLCAGNYTVDIKDANNCTKTVTFTVSQPPATTVNISYTDPTSCVGNNGVISATLSGGVPNYNYTISPGPTGSTSSSFTVNTLSSGVYSIIVKDANGCSTTSVVALNGPGGPTITSISTQSVSCFNGSNGSATVVATSTNPPLSYTWNPSVSTNSVASGLPSGVYVVTIGDAGSCTTSSVISISQPAQFSLNPTVTQPNCNSNCSGAISVSPAGGTPAYSYTWSTGSNASFVNSLCPGTYTLDILDANNCSYTQTFTINPPSTLNVTANTQNVLCNSACNGTIGLIVSGGTAPYSYSWTPVGSFPGSTLPSIVGLCPNVYTVNIQDNGSCNVTLTYTITEPPVLTSTVVNTPSVNCNGDCSGSATVTVNGGVSPYSYSWSGTVLTSSVVNTLCAGTYSSIVTDANGCQSIKTFIIDQPAPISVSVTPTNPTCFNLCDGIITSTVVGGNGGYTYTWIPSGGNSSTASNLCAGNYTLLIKDSKNCQGQQVTSLINPPKILANISFTNPTSCSNCNGMASSNPFNATAPINFTWTSSPPQSTPTATGLCAGTYTVYIQDNKGCRDSGQVTLSAPVILTVNPSMSPSDCSVCNGSITLATSGGTGPYSYTWQPSVSTGSMATNLCSGVYTVTVSDVNNCSQTFQLPLSNSNGPSGITITFTNVSCNSYCDGMAIASPPITGGTAPYTYTWVTPPVASATISNLCAGVYTVQVTDANNCKFFQSVTISEPSPLNANANIQNPKCNGICDGSISLSPTGGTAPYSYTWNTGSSSNSVTSLCPGVYSVSVFDNNGCQYPLTYTLTGGISITASTFVINNNCFYDCNGTASLVGIAGGLPPYVFHWSDPLGQSNSTAIGLCNGNYTCTVTDNNGCFGNFSVTITSPSSITTTYNSNNPSCGNCDGSINLNLSGGTPGYTVQWSNGNSGMGATNLCAGLYMITITDANGCTQNEFIPLSNNSSLITAITVTNPACFGDCVGSATITASGGTPPYSYLWINSGNTSNIENGLCSGTYYVQVKDSMNCINTESVNIVATNTIQIIPIVYQPSCGTNNGSIIANINGGTPPFTYTWLPGNISSATLTNIGPGTYTLNISNAAGCTTSSVFVVSSQNGPLATLSIIDAACNTSCDGAASVSVTAGVSPYTITWYDGTVVNGNFSNLSGLCSGLITATVTDNAGCLTVLSGSISSPIGILNSIPTVHNPKCYGDTDGSITIITSGGTLPYSYTFQPSGSTTNPLVNIGTGNYTVIIQDANNCPTTLTIDINQPQPIVVNASITDPSCSALFDGSITISVTGGNPTYTYNWNGPNSYTNNTGSISNIGVGTYSLSIIDSKGCTHDTSFVVSSTLTLLASVNSGTAQCGAYTYTLDGSTSINATSYQWTQLPSTTIANTSTAVANVSVGSNTFILTVTNGTCIDTEMVVLVGYPLPNVDAGPYVAIPKGASAVIGGNPTASTATNYVWIPATGLNSPNIPNPTTSTTLTTTYTVIVTDANGCTNWDTVTVYIYPEIDIPSGFSPNGDGKNDYWVIDNIHQFPDCEVEVYNRWGEQLFYSKGYSTPWDGKYKGQDVPVGTYYYIIRLNSKLYPKDYTGPLTVFR